MDYKTVIFIDTNVALQCLDLRQLPWFEIDRVGPVLVLVTPTVLREVDSKKNDGRLGDHARRFNSLLRPLLGTEEAVEVRSSPEPQVYVGLARCSPIQWHLFPELDQSESDARIIAESLHTEVLATSRRVFVSQDIRPLDLARRHGFQIHHIEENWLRPKEMSEAERKASALSKELASLKSKQPELIFEWEFIPSPVETILVKDLSSSERETVLNQIRKANPKRTQERRTGPAAALLDDYDHTLDERYNKWSNHLLPNFMEHYESKLELMYNQVEISLVLKNIGKVQAESLLLKLTAAGGWLNSKWILVPLAGPSAPQPISRFGMDLPYLPRRASPPRGRHEIVVEESPERSNYVQITCDDFRHGSEYKYRCVAWLDPRSEAPFELDAVATASNLHGEASASLILPKRVVSTDVFDLVDFNAELYRKQPLAQKVLQQVKDSDFSFFELEKYEDQK